MGVECKSHFPSRSKVTPHVVPARSAVLVDTSKSFFTLILVNFHQIKEKLIPFYLFSFEECDPSVN